MKRIRNQATVKGRKHTSGIKPLSTHLHCKEINAACDAFYVRRYGRKAPEVSTREIGVFVILPDSMRIC